MKISYLLSEILFRVMIITIFLYTENMIPFIRVIHKEEWWLYQNPYIKEQRVTTFGLYMIALCCPLATIFLFCGILRGAKNDIMPAILAYTLGLVLNGIITNSIKLSVGRPRPDFYYRCFPDGNPPTGQPSVLDLKCIGDYDTIIEGRKSFPSGHSSFSFLSLGFCAIYMTGKLHCFNSIGRGRSMNLGLCLLPLLAATLIAISRTCDYRHHWQDILIGSVLGLLISYVSYRQYYPSIFDSTCHQAFVNQQDSHTVKSNAEQYDVSATSAILTEVKQM